MKKYLQSFLLMLQFMTRIPILLNLPCQKEDFRRGTAFLPLIGALIGFIEWCVFYLSSQVLPLNISAVLTIIASILITGAIHIDGLGDTCDGFFSSKGTDKIIGIMKDSRIGTYACLAIICDILLKVTALSNLNSIKASFIIIVAPMIGRTAMVLLFKIGKCAKENGTGNLFIGNAGKLQVLLSLFITLAISILLIGAFRSSILITFSILIVVFLNKYCTKKIGGLTGDTLGATNEIIELSVFILCSIL
jgi:adenosylcobinamide-GDP ribazoletransferase